MATALSKLRKHLCSSGKTRPSSVPGELCRHFSLREIKEATCYFSKELIFGEGPYGTVYKGFIDKGNSRPVAIKRLKKKVEEEFKTEIILLCQIHHVHLVPFIGYCKDEGEMILVYDFMANKSLREHLYGTDRAPLLWKQRLQICVGAARGLHYLQTGLKHAVIHRNVKTTSILLDEKWVAKVSRCELSVHLVVDMEGTRGPSDSGLSEQISSINTTASYNELSAMTRKKKGAYLDPEYSMSHLWTAKSDVYSFGMVLLEVLCARKPFNKELKEEQRHLADWFRKCNGNGSIGKIIDPYLKGKIASECFKVYVEIAGNCVQNEGIQRPTMLDVLEKLELALELQEKADSEREKMISAGSDIMKDLFTNSQT
ncbi:hypothetical protein I3842_14G112100 [Carya illinoinensis]|uniref:Protein kinase domain-containing protein n=1 Tax=Carya illinoinensis TaxID=32201 RepID=A0A922ACF2_CARIL|nr:hypothetical protein I3842_14G112100 [Carya illinoinensis]